jgi:hypothetical protein
MAVHKPWTAKNRCAYNLADRVADIAPGFKRCRKEQSFILSDAGVETDKPHCDSCGHALTIERGNRGHYYPSKKKHVIYHYDCAWAVTFQDLDRLLARVS